MEETIEIVSVKDGKFHRPDNVVFNGGSNDLRNARLMRCGRSLVPLNFFETVASADQYTGGRLERYICQQCERKVSHLWRVPAILKNGAPALVDETTARPWHFETHLKMRGIGEHRIMGTNEDAGKSGVSYSGRFLAIATTESRDDALLIVKAVNGHDALIQTLERIADMAHKGSNGGLSIPGKSTSVGDCKALMRGIRDAARAALEAA